MSSTSRAPDRGTHVSRQTSELTESALYPKTARLEDVLITHELQNRDGREPKWKEESIALSMLASVVATDPERLVDALLGMALELCGAETAGLSMLESAPSVQQSLVNIHRHSGSRTAKIQLSARENVVRVEICDDGCGIPPEILSGIAQGMRLVGVGIAGMRERIRMLGGQFEVRSSERGTTIEASLPMEPQ